MEDILIKIHQKRHQKALFTLELFDAFSYLNVKDYFQVNLNHTLKCERNFSNVQIRTHTESLFVSGYGTINVRCWKRFEQVTSFDDVSCLKRKLSIDCVSPLLLDIVFYGSVPFWPFLCCCFCLRYYFATWHGAYLWCEYKHR